MNFKSYIFQIIFVAFGFVAVAQNSTNAVLGTKETNLATIKTLLQHDEQISFELLRTENDQFGNVHYIYQPSYAGFKVEYMTYTLYTKEGKLLSANGNYTPLTVEISKQPIASQAVLQTTLQKIRQQAQDPNIGATASKTAKETNPLVIFPAIGINKVARLCYKFSLRNANVSYAANVYADAQTGEIVSEVSTVCGGIPAVGKANTYYSGQVNIRTEKKTDGTFELNNLVQRIKTTSALATPALIDADNEWTAAEYGENIHAFDAHANVATAQAFFDGNFNNPGAYQTLQVFVNEEPQGGAAAASYHDNEIHITKGGQVYLADNSTTVPSTPLTCFDIMAHEYAHHIGQNFFALYYAGESGAIHESLSDIWAACMTGDFVIAEQAMQGGIRSMANPKSRLQPNTYLGQYYVNANTTQVVHTNNSIMNHWFYLLCQGGSGVNDNGNSYAITPIGMSLASNLVYTMQRAYLTSTDGFMKARTASQTALKAMGYTECSTEYKAVTDAWYAVGVGAAYTPPPIIFSPANYLVLCENENLRYEASFAVPNCYYKWEIVTPTNVAITSLSEGTDINNIGLYYTTPPGTLHIPHYFTLRLTVICGIHTIVKEQRIWAGQPLQPTEIKNNIGDVACIDRSYPVEAVGAEGNISHYTWHSSDESIASVVAQANSQFTRIFTYQTGIVKI
jgi:Zn-dependent metalloprotease